MIKDITKETPERILFLMRLCHPNEKGEPYSRWDVVEEISRRGLDLLKDLGWWGDGFEEVWKNRYTASEETLGRQLHHWCLQDNPEEHIEQLPYVMENWTPKKLWTDKDCFPKYKEKATLSGWM